MKKSTRIILAIFLVLVVLIGAATAAYPIIAARHNASIKNAVLTEYHEIIQQKPTLEADWQAAHDYNAQLSSGAIDILNPEENGYYDVLDVDGAGLMGYIRIPKLEVSLPVYHGVGESLSFGVGHMPQTSLPVGGENTHSVLSAHSGMASDVMFSDLPLMEAGDLFFLDVLDDTLCYQVEDILTVLPSQTEALAIQPGRDLCTLVTCTPFGINTHRLLVRGSRIPWTEQVEEQAVEQAEQKQDDSVWESVYFDALLQGALVAGGVLVLAVLAAVFIRRKKK